MAITIFGAASARADDPVDRTKKLIAAFKNVQTAAPGKPLSAAEQKANAAAYKKLDGFFAFDEFGDACFGPSGTKLDAKVRKNLKQRLVDVLRRRGYANAGASFKEGVLTYAAPRSANGQTVTPVEMKFPKQDLSMTVAFVWGKSARVVDLIIDDDSLVADLSNQIGRVLKKSGPDDLAKRLAAKQDELAKEGL